MSFNPEREFQRKFIGNITFYRELSFNRPPLFLQRNIAEFLHYHKYKQNHLRHKANAPDPRKMSSSSEPGQNLTTPHQSILSTWSIGEIFSKLEKGITGAEPPVLRIDITGIRDRKAVFRNLPEQKPSLKRIRTTSVHAQCLLTIWATGSSRKEDPSYLVQQSKSCIIEAGTRDSGERTATVTMESPFFVKFDELLITGRKPLSGYSNQMYDMQISLLPANATDPWPPMDFLAPPPKISQRMEADGLVRFPMLLAQWRKLPQLPETPIESLLEASAYQDGKRYKTKLSVKIEAAWSNPSSPLASHNTVLRNALTPAPHLPSPVSDHDTTGPIVSVIWIFQGLWDHLQPIEFYGYLCPLCQRHPSPNMDTYHFHLLTRHDLFKFELITRANSVGNRQKIDVEVLVDVTDTFSVKASSNVLDEREMNWQKPQTLFDLEAFLKGNKTWIGQENKRKSQLVPPRPTLGNIRSISGDSAQNEIPVAIRSRNADEVPNLPAPDRQKFAVPGAPPDIKFFRLTVKRPLREGEYISESDDEMDENWLLQKHNDTIESFSDMSHSEKRFIQHYDRHMLDENLSSNLHFREALIRFCRLNKHWLQERDMRVEFHKNAARLLLQGLISPQLLRDCAKIIGIAPAVESKVEIMDTGEDEPQKTSSLTKRPNNKQPQSIAPNLRSQASVREKTRSPTEAVHDYGRCQCSSRIYSMHRSIRCSNTYCIAPDFHLECVGLTQRTLGWICPICDKSTPTFQIDTRHNFLESNKPFEMVSPVVTAKRHSPKTSGPERRGTHARQMSSTCAKDSTATHAWEGLQGYPEEHPGSISEVSPRKHREAVAAPVVRESLQNSAKEVPGSSQSSSACALHAHIENPGQRNGSDKGSQEKHQRTEASSSESDEPVSDDSPEYEESDDDDPVYEDIDDDFTDEDRDLMMSEEERLLEDESDEVVRKTRFPKTRSAGSETMDEDP